MAKALERSLLTLGEIDCFDIYSCFPCAVTIAKRMLGLADNDPRPLTLTGGLGFFGGPGNNYSLHAIATLAETIASGYKETGLITSLGWFLHKHAAGVYSSRPGETDFGAHALADRQDWLVGNEPVKIVDRASGPGCIETYTVKFLKNGLPASGVIYGKTTAGFRFAAQSNPDHDILNLLVSQNQVGKTVHLRYGDRRGLNIAEIA